MYSFLWRNNWSQLWVYLMFTVEWPPWSASCLVTVSKYLDIIGRNHFMLFLQLARTKTINSDPNWQYVNIVNYIIGNLPPRQREFIWLYSSLGIQSSIPVQQIIVLVAIKGSAKPCAIYKTRLSIILSWTMMIQPDNNTNVLYILIIVLWLKYCRHGVKHRSINQSILSQSHL